MDSNYVAPKVEHQGTGAAHASSTPFIKTCCVPGSGALPINIPVYSPIYYGNHVLSGASGIVPQQQYVFASPVPRNDQVCPVQPMNQPESNYQIQGNLFSGQQQGVNAEQPVNVTHYVWRQSSPETAPVQSQGSFAKLMTLFNPLEYASTYVGNADAQKVEEKPIENSEEQKAEVEGEAITEEVSTEEKQPKAKKQPMCSFLSSCCRAPEEYPGFENAGTNIFHMNTLFRENSYGNEGNSNLYQLHSVSRGSSIHNAVSVPVTTMGSVISQPSITSQSGMIPQGGIMQQNSIPSHASTNVYHLNTLFQESENRLQPPMCFNMCYPRTNSIQTETVVPMATIPSQSSISVAPAAGVLGSCCGGYMSNATVLPMQNSFGILETLASNPPSQRSVFSNPPNGVESLSRQLSTVNLHQPMNEVAPEVAQSGSSRLVAPPQLLVQDTAVVNTANTKQRNAPMKPKTFKLHAVEIHQFVASPNTPDPRFVETVGNMNVQGAPMFQHSYGIQHPNCFFNPNTTGLVAPVMRDVMGGVEKPKIPHMYSMDSVGSRQAVRLQTDESQITAREDTQGSKVDVTTAQPQEEASDQGAQ